MRVIVEGKGYEVAHYFSARRAIINYEGLFVLIDHVNNDQWELSGEPARENEKPILNALVAPLLDKSILTVTPPED